VIRILLGAFIIAHGLLTAFIWVSPPSTDAPFHPWLLAGIAISAAILYAAVQALPQA
jgi:uncharacterized membrane protein